MTREPRRRLLRISRLSQVETSWYGRGTQAAQIKEMAELEARAQRWEREMNCPTQDHKS